MTLFLRFTLAPQRDLLFIEASHSLLTPVLQRYRAVDGLRGRPTARQLLKAAPGIFSTLGATTACIPRLLFTAYSLLTRHWQNRNELRAIRDDRVFNYGPRISPREAASDQQCHRYFQELDSEMYEGLVQRRVLDTLTDFLTEHNVDVGDLKEQRTTILNHGIYVTGQGSLSAKNVAAGASALSLSLDMLKRNKSPQKSSRGASS